ncbi:MAG: peroxidase [Gammaproteobacteria bacterium]|nr:peroxidase [Gammaproteobacteria bacterium]MDH5312108.1 peroxidase [Gammaproteobacteria bacterium]
MAFVQSIPADQESVGTVMKLYPDQGIPLTELTEIVMRSGECGFSLAERELLAAFASGTNACTFCYNTHRATAEAFGIDEALLDALLTDLDGAPVNEKLKPVLRYVRKLTQTPSRMTQADADAIFDAGWSENDFHFAVMICALFNLYNRLMDGYGVRNTAAFREERGRMLADAGYAWVIDIFRREL